MKTCWDGAWQRRKERGVRERRRGEEWREGRDEHEGEEGRGGGKKRQEREPGTFLSQARRGSSRKCHGAVLQSWGKGGMKTLMD